MRWRLTTILGIVLRALGALAALSGCSETGLEHGSAGGADVILVTLDTTRADRLGAYGYADAETPVLDRLAREGILYRTAISPAPLTLPSHASILTGLSPPSHGVHHNGQYRLEDDVQTLAETLAGAGYRTAAFVSAFVLDRRYGVSQGFELYNDRVAPSSNQTVGGLDSQRSATEVTNEALGYLAKSKHDLPIFLWVHYYDPHLPYHPPTGFDASYDGELAYVDTELGRLVAAIEQRSRQRLVVIAGDHGEGFGEHGESGHSRLLYDETQRVPLILWGDVLGRAQVVDEIAALVDITPTILDLTGLAGESVFDGTSLLTRDSDRLVYMETLATYLDNGWAPLYGLRGEHEKYILAPEREYYDLRADPSERRNLYPSPRAHEIETTLEARLAAGPSIVDASENVRQMSDDEQERLRSLGYLGGGGRAASSSDDSALRDPKEMMAVLELLAQAERLRQEERFAEALERASRAHRGAPEDLQVLQSLGVIYAQMGRMEDAERVLRDYLNRKENPNVTILLAGVVRESARIEEARQLLEQAIAREPEHGGLLISLGDLLAREGRGSDALRLYRRAKEVDPYRASATADARIVELRTQ